LSVPVIIKKSQNEVTAVKTTFFPVTMILMLALAANAQPAQQNARQALLEMFFGKPGSFEKHLPKATIAALREASGNGPSMLDQLSMISALANAQGNHIQTFETGSTLLTIDDERTQSKFEVTVENDDLRNDEDEIMLAFHGSKNGEPAGTPFLPTLSALMKQEAGVWKLNELSITLRVPLADPNFLKGLVAGIKQRQAMAGGPATVFPGSSTTTPQIRPNEAIAVASMRSILTAETTYAASYPAHGFTCSLSDLDGFGNDSPNEQHAMLLESRLASGKKGGYTFQLSGCGGSPSRQFQLTATPANPGPDARVLCSDQSGLLRYSIDSQASTCVVSGKPLQ
jgi:hypothetical protein